MKLIKIYVFNLVALFLLSGCENWLDVKSEDRIMENTLYSSREGFLTALNGLYIDMITSSLYTSGNSNSLDIMAQMWNIDENHNQLHLSNLEGANKNSFASAIWTNSYKLLVNVNTLIEHCETDRDVLDDKYYGIIKGEALAIRALIHFDLLRVFGPIFSATEKNVQLTIPYANSSDIIIRPLLSADSVASLIMTDYQAAEKLLHDYDPIIEEGPLASDVLDESNNFRYRNFRLNYYAVKGLIARTALYCKKNDIAIKYAEDVIKEVTSDHNYFTFITTDLLTAESYPDRIFSSEILFAFYNMKRYEDWFSPFSQTMDLKSVLTMDKKYKDALYSGLSSDIRNQSLWEERMTTNTQIIQCFIKYDQVKKNSSVKNSLEHEYMVPVIRLSEIYLILAEADIDSERARDMINVVRFNRGIPNIEAGVSTFNALQDEIAREFLGEGQLFWFYKRNNVESIKSYGMEKDMDMTDNKYLFSIPESEKQVRK